MDSQVRLQELGFSTRAVCELPAPRLQTGAESNDQVTGCWDNREQQCVSPSTRGGAGHTGGTEKQSAAALFCFDCSLFSHEVRGDTADYAA